MTATADFRQVAQYIGLAICALIMRTALWVFGILWGIVREIVNGMFRVAIGIIVAIFSTIAFFGFILGYSPLILTDMNKTTEKMPTWSLCYLINGDATGLTDNEILLIDKWMNDWQVQIVSPITDEEGNAQPYFSRYPLFGLPAEVEDCDILYLNDNPSKI